MEVMERAGMRDEMLLMTPMEIQQSEQVEDGFLLPSCQTFMGKRWDYRCLQCALCAIHDCRTLP